MCQKLIFLRSLFTLGEVAQLCPSNVNKRMFLMMQSIIFHQNHCANNSVTVDRIPSTQTQSSQPPLISSTHLNKTPHHCPYVFLRLATNKSRHLHTRGQAIYTLSPPPKTSFSSSPSPFSPLSSLHP